MNTIKTTLLLLVAVGLCGFLSCNNKSAHKNTTTKESAQVFIPSFSADSAYNYIQNQVDFGYRIPNTKEHQACAQYLAETLTRFGASVTEQRVDLTAFDGTVLNAVNIIASFEPEKKNRLLLFAHWDTRPWADNDPDKNNHKKPVLGANDGASGAGVLLEIARLLGQHPTEVGIDIILFDAEDYGVPSQLGHANENSWCLGSQYWARNPHIKGYRAKYGILLDMVGAKGAVFYREQVSEYFAKDIVDKVWSKAQNLGFGNYFVNRSGGMITDDHLYVNQLIGIPSINIIQYDPNTVTGFGDFWHTVNDTMENIDKSTLNAVGTTVLNVIYNEK